MCGNATERVCISCGQSHSAAFFNRDRTRADGLDPRCKNCTRRACKDTYRRHRDKHVALKRRWKAGNVEYNKEINREYQQANPEKIRGLSTAYRARLRRATPAWVDAAEINRVREACPKGFHVDHIFPLAGENCSGLNVPWNLQYLPAAEHYKKGRRLTEPQEVYYL